jgi:HEAT repeat protein
MPTSTTSRSSGTTTPTYSADWVFQALTSGRGTAKEAAIRAIDGLRSSKVASERAVIDQLRPRLMSALTSGYVPRPPEAEDHKHSDTRCWLLSSLGRIAAGDPAAEALVRKHLHHDYELYVWGRYWAFEGLISGGADDLDQLAAKLVDQDDPKLADLPVRALIPCLANAVLAQRGDKQALQAVEQKLTGDSNDQFAILRALRVVPLGEHEPVVARLCDLVDQGGYSDITFEAIVALGRLPRDSRHVGGAAHSLSEFLVEYRWPMYDSMRAKALIGLGKLGVERTASVLVEELLDDSPVILYEAARALERVLGLPTATARVVEAASRAEPARLTRFADALRSMDRDAVVEQLEAEMISGPEDRRAIAQGLLSEIGGQRAYQRLKARTDATNRYLEILEHAERKVRRLFQETLEDARRGFQLATVMDLAVFVVGLCFVVFGGYLASASQDKWTAFFTGLAGVAGTTYGVLIAKPRERVRESVDHLMHLKLVFLAYLRQLHQVDQAYTRKILEQGTILATELKEFSALVNTVMVGAVGELNGKTQVTGKIHPNGKIPTAVQAPLAPSSLPSPDTVANS